VDKGFSGPEVITVDFFALIQERRVSTGIVYSSVRLGCVVWPCRVATSIFISKFGLKGTASLNGKF